MLLPLLTATALALAPCTRPADEARGGGRPSLSGPEQTVLSDDGQFVVHWTEEGVDRPADMGDDDGDGIPDGVDLVLEALTDAAADYEAMGWRTVLPDEGGGGTPEIDVYLREITAFGFAWHVPVADGTSCYVELDPGNTSLGDETARSVAAHELHHCVQYAYTNAAESWIYEATATFEQYRLYTGGALEFALGVLWNQRLRGMDAAIHLEGDRYEYAGFLLFKHLFDRGDGEGTVRAVWDALADDPDWAAALDSATRADLGESFEAAFGTYALWNLFACARDDGAHYDAATHGCVLEAAQVNVEELSVDAGEVAFLHVDAPFTALFAELPNDGEERPLALACSVEPEGAVAEIRLVAIDVVGSGGEVASGSGGGGVELRLTGAVDPQGRIGIVGASVGPAPAEIQCGLARVEPATEPPAEGCTCEHGEPPAGMAIWLLALALVGATGRCRTSRRSSACS